MDFDRILEKCGDAGRYQYLMLLLLGYIAFTSTVHYYSQNIIGFVPQHWCYHEQLANRSHEEIAAIYAGYGRDSSCQRLETIEQLADGTYNITLSNNSCDRWIYKYDYGFRSMNAEVSKCSCTGRSTINLSLLVAQLGLRRCIQGANRTVAVLCWLPVGNLFVWYSRR